MHRSQVAGGIGFGMASLQSKQRTFAVDAGSVAGRLLPLGGSPL